MRPSDWPLRYKIEAVVLYTTIMLGLWFLLRWLVPKIPEPWITVLPIIGISLGVIFGWLPLLKARARGEPPRHSRNRQSIE